MADRDFIDLLLLLLGQSFLAIGGLWVVLAELYRVIVVVNGWVSATEFTSLFALAQASPGPNALFVTLVGWRMAGIPGGIAATAAFMLPAALLVAVVSRMWNRWQERRWFAAVQSGLIPLTIGLMAASAWLLINAASWYWQGYLVTALATAVALWTRLPPVVILAVAAVAGATGMV